MSQYIHAVKAGNIGDVWKHFCLYELWEQLRKGREVSLYLETHAGAGYYELTEANRDQWGPGIGAILEHSGSAFNRHPLVTGLIARRGDVWLYPGSAAVAGKFIRPEAMHLFEANGAVADMLQRHMPGANIHREDGWSGSIRVLRAAGGTGHPVIFIDPPYKDERDWRLVPEIAGQALELDAGSIIIGWYPIDSGDGASLLIRSLQGLGKPAFAVDCVVYPESEDSGRLIGSGMFVVNVGDDDIAGRLERLSAELREAMSARRANS